MTVRKFFFCFVVFFGLFMGSTPKSHAQILTRDNDEIIETIAVIAKQIMQFEVMLRNTIGPLVFIYDQVQDIRSQIQNLDNLSTTYQIFGGISDVLQDNKDLGDFISKNCQELNICNAKSVLKWQRKKSTIQTALEKSRIKMNAQQQKIIQADTQTILNLQTAVQQADGRMKAQQDTNQILLEIAHQVLELRTFLVSQNAPEAQNNLNNTTDKAKSEAFTHQFMQQAQNPSQRFAKEHLLMKSYLPN